MCFNKLCRRFTPTDGITFAGDSLVINLPAGSYSNCEKYCIVIADSRPAGIIAGSPVVFTIGGGAEQYPLIDRCGQPVTERAISPRTMFGVILKTTTTGGSFVIPKYRSCNPSVLESIDGTAPAAEGGGGA